ncbi:FG-GAP-like repeat-containing protein [Oligoflexia bacterium]|nr:FG-GAP-like repeat-containing protein [Oligoflexia bacterium]
MSLRIGSNIAALKAQRRLFQADYRQRQVYERLASGQRINRASDDAAGLAIADSLRSNSRVLTQGANNVNDGISLVNIADAALAQLSGIATRIVELSEQAANGTFSRQQRRSLDNEAQALRNEYFRIVESTEFNGSALLNGSNPIVDIQVGLDSSTNSRIGITVEGAATRLVGTGDFTASGNFSIPGGSAFLSTAGGDIDNDGDNDVVIGAGSGVEAFLNDGSGGFAATVHSGIGTIFTQTFLTDLNSDGNLDIIANDLGVVSTSLGNGTGSFGGISSFGANFSGIAIGDINGDLIDDVIAASETDSLVQVYISDGSGGLTAGQTLNFNIVAQAAPSLADMNNDGILDIVGGGGPASDNDAFIALGNGSGGFGAATYFTSSHDDGSQAIVDVNGDGNLDLVHRTSSQNEVNILFGDGNGNLGSEQKVSTPSNGPSLLAGDVTGDGIVDLMVESGADTLIMAGDGSGGFTQVSQLSPSFDDQLALVDIDGDSVADLVGGNNATSRLDTFLAETQVASGLPEISLLTRSDALDTLDTVRGALEQLAAGRGVLGAQQARLEVAMANNKVGAENAVAAESRIRDADVAQEASELVRTQILQQTAASVLAQANTIPALAVRLLS